MIDKTYIIKKNHAVSWLQAQVHSGHSDCYGSMHLASERKKVRGWLDAIHTDKMRRIIAQLFTTLKNYEEKNIFVTWLKNGRQIAFLDSKNNQIQSISF